MPSRMIHYLVAEQVAERISIRDKNRFKIGSLCPDMSWRQDDSKHRTHYSDIDGDKKGINWKRYVESYSEKMKQDDLYLGVLCHLITDCIGTFLKSPERRGRSLQYILMKHRLPVFICVSGSV